MNETERANAVAIIDHSQLTNLRELAAGDHAFLVSVIDAFLPQLQEVPISLRRALDSGEAASVAELAHSLKGSAGNVGAEDVHELCVAIERHARAGELTKVPRLVAELESAARAAHRAFEREKAQLA